MVYKKLWGVAKFLKISGLKKICLKCLFSYTMLEYAISYFWVGLKRINLKQVPLLFSSFIMPSSHYTSSHMHKNTTFWLKKITILFYQQNPNTMWCYAYVNNQNATHNSQNSQQKSSLKTYSEETLKYKQNSGQPIKISKKIFLSFLKTTKLPIQIVW